MTSSSSLTESSRPAINWGRFAFIGVATVVAAVVANIIAYYVLGAIIRYDPTFLVLQNVSPVILFTVVPAILAVLLYALLLRYNSDPARTFTVIAIVVLIGSIVPDITYIPTVPGASPAQAVALALMHVIAAVVITLMLTRLNEPEA